MVAARAGVAGSVVVEAEEVVVEAAEEVAVACLRRVPSTLSLG